MKRHLVTMIAVVLLLASATAADDPYTAAALDAARWIEASAIRTKDGVVWPADPNDPKSINTTLYAGTPGPTLFLLELYRHTGHGAHLVSARDGADALLAGLAKEDTAGLYEGIAGVGFVLGETYLVTKEAKYRDGALRTVQWLQDHAQRVGRGVQWNTTTDIIAGSSGTGLFLLWAARTLDAPGARNLAADAGRRLIEVAQVPKSGQMKWMMDDKYPTEMPNFSHGTAGVSYFLTTLYRDTRERAFLDAALAGARYLLSVADTDGEMCVIYHDDGAAGKSLYYLSWCHGPAGTARLFYRLHQITSDLEWMAWAKKAARGVLSHGGPEKAVTPGAWDNVGACCGVAGEGAFLLGLYHATRDATYLEAAKKAGAYMLSKATRDDRGMRWVQAEHRVKPDLRVAQTGLMQGAAGIGLFLLHLDAAITRRSIEPMTLPDNPFAY